MSARISDSAVRRLSLYLRMLRELRRSGAELVSSRELAEKAGATSAQVRKDLSLFGSFGKRGRGYDVSALADTLEGILGLSKAWKVALVGVGKIGTALLGYRGLGGRGFDLVAAFDVDPEKIGTRTFGVEVRDVTELERVVRARGVDIGIVATPAGPAREVAARLAAAGVGAILNFAPTELGDVDGVPVRTVDIVLELEGLSYLIANARRGENAETTASG